MIWPFQCHPFAVEAYFERSLVLSFALPKERLEPLLPRYLELDTYRDRQAFLAVAMVQTRDLRPAGLPRWAGRDFSLIGYRLFVRYRNARGRTLRGLYILRSETDRLGMQLGGNLFTRYNYRRTDVAWESGPSMIAVSSEGSALDVRADVGDDEVALPPDSPFPDWKKARRFAGPMPYTFSHRRGGRQVLIVRGVRQGWKPRPVNVRRHDVGFLQRNGLGDAVLANAFMVRGIPYLWERGRRETFRGAA